MAPRVIFRAPSTVKMTYVTFKMEHVWSVNLGYMDLTVTYRVQPTVMTTRATVRMEHVLHVNLDGLEYNVKQVVLIILHVIRM